MHSPLRIGARSGTRTGGRFSAGGFIIGLGLVAWTAVSSFGQAKIPDAQSPLDPALVTKADSLRREIEKRTLSDADKKELRACNREKTEFLKKARAADPEYAGTDQALNQAKLAGSNPNDPAIMALMERKFAFEKAFDERYLATPKGKACAAGEARRHKALAAALRKDKPYQDLLKRIAASSPDHL